MALECVSYLCVELELCRNVPVGQDGSGDERSETHLDRLNVSECLEYFLAFVYLACLIWETTTDTGHLIFYIISALVATFLASIISMTNIPGY